MDKNEKMSVISEVSRAIKPTLWFTNSILDKAELATETEIGVLKSLSAETTDLKSRAWAIDKQIEKILSAIDRRGEEK